ncbi:type VI secretion system baseplate subunit TssF [Marinobacter sp. chi1]|uniref:Type VI secretion system baseplate subunit TssF n=1 Tax=Marinobacter suaedae TaxID=3057675 RepID=A0ABT8VW60_9GAMM|nr:type VI secretion system baseplate subunit TssF [Marinobacter sp. chi1]MDO3720180.1 type VI secretion system baseplate subunit TssF [Marinobacter sp. chi1]
MSDHLLRHYEQELAFLKEEASRFAINHPGIASRLKLGEDELQDPLVEHLISAVAFLNARIQYRLDESFPEYSKAMLDALYPHYLRPVPPCTIVRFDTTRYFDTPSELPAKITLETEPFVGRRCLFRTGYPTQLVPLAVEDTQLLFRPCATPAANEVRGNAIIHLKLKANEGVGAIRELKLDQLRFFIGGQDRARFDLYELIFNKATAIVVSGSDNDPAPHILDRNAIRTVGFTEDEGLLPYAPSSFMGYRLLTEFFVSQDKFLFFDIVDLGEALARLDGKTLHLHIYLEDAPNQLEHQISTQHFQLGCTPAVNLFSQTADPIRMDFARHSYSLEPDVTQHDSLEIYSIDTVHAIDASGKPRRLLNYFDSRPIHFEQPLDLYWLSERELAYEGDQRKEQTSNVSLNFVNTKSEPESFDDLVITVETTCFNRNTLSRLPFNQGISLSSPDGNAPAIPIALVVAPTPVMRVLDEKDIYWRLISHLNLNHLSLTEGDSSLQTLKDILRLYDFRNSSSSKSLIDSIVALSTRPVSATIKIGETYGPARGLEVHLTFDQQRLGGQSPYLFASILEHFFGLYCHINSFTRTAYSLKGQETPEATWPPRSGEQSLL